MFCTATLGGQIIKIIYEKDNILIFTIRNIKGKYQNLCLVLKVMDIIIGTHLNNSLKN